MKISDNELREKILNLLGLKGSLATTDIVNFCETWVSRSKTAATLNGLLEEAEVNKSCQGTNRTNQVMWSLVADKPFTKPVVSEKVENVVHKLTPEEVKENFKDLPIKIRNAELDDLLAKEYRIMLKKQERRRDWAAQVLQNSENLVKLIEGKIAELV